MDGVAKRLEELRAARGWSGREFSRRAEVDEKQFAKIQERGGNGASVEVIAKLAMAAGASVEWVVTGRGSPDAVVTRSSATPMLWNVEGFWESAAAVLRESPQLTAGVVGAGYTSALLFAGPATPELVRHFAQAWFDSLSADELERVEREQVRNEMEAQRLFATRVEARAAEMRARGESISSMRDLAKQLRREESESARGETRAPAARGTRSVAARKTRRRK